MMKRALKILSGVAFILSLLSMGAYAQGTAQSSTAVTFPELKSSYLKTGDFVNLENLRKVAAGLHKDQIRLLLGNPHFSAGVANPRIWNYAFNFYTGSMGAEYAICQYQVHFDKAQRVQAVYWKDQQCANFLIEKKPVAAAPPVREPSTKTMSLSTDGLFAFGRSDLSRLRPSDQESLQQLLSQIQSSSIKLNSILITGYTDRLGSDAQNMALSNARAVSVKNYLVSRGIPPNLIFTQGRGAADPVVDCPGRKSPKVIACLMPNRRIEVLLRGES
ncbi:OmpA family protein [Hydromonas duriensis]|uniref:Beta-barrel assembly machine subunit BamE n=1 Tax=Hydromonas duriensis TaxID=1527608 RepID=A0A4V3DJI3_9BURK|nr:OmpA family protein [Hydromonas duriensis]TDR30180.1 Beta-barrel assembly machine subunit BamE [Hydromonas duriensis]